MADPVYTVPGRESPAMYSKGQEARVESCRLPVTRDGFPRCDPFLRDPMAVVIVVMGAWL
jgi:hypothetical protein